MPSTPLLECPHTVAAQLAGGRYGTIVSSDSILVGPCWSSPKIVFGRGFLWTAPIRKQHYIGLGPWALRKFGLIQVDLSLGIAMVNGQFKQTIMCEPC